MHSAGHLISPAGPALTGLEQPYGAAYGVDNSVAEQANLELVDEFHKKVLAGHSVNSLDKYVSPEFVNHHPFFGRGRAGLAEFAGFLAAFSDLSCFYDVSFAQNNRVLTMVTWTGTHDRTGEKLIWHTVHVYRVLEGMIAEHWALIDYYGIEPFGVTPPAHQHQPAMPIDWFGSAAQRANLRLFTTFANDMFTERRKEDSGKYVTTDFFNNDPMEKFGGQIMSGQGVEGFQHCFIWYDWVPDMTFTLDHVISGENHVGALWSWYGNHVSGQKFQLHTADLYRVSDGKMAEHWTLWDFSQLRPFGIVPPQP